MDARNRMFQAKFCTAMCMSSMQMWLCKVLYTNSMKLQHTTVLFEWFCLCILTLVSSKSSSNRLMFIFICRCVCGEKIWNAKFGVLLKVRSFSCSPFCSLRSFILLLLNFLGFPQWFLIWSDILLREHMQPLNSFLECLTGRTDIFTLVYLIVQRFCK